MRNTRGHSRGRTPLLSVEGQRSNIDLVWSPSPAILFAVGASCVLPSTVSRLSLPSVQPSTRKGTEPACPVTLWLQCVQKQACYHPPFSFRGAWFRSEEHT